MKNTAHRIQDLALPKQSHARRIVLVGLCMLGLFVAAYVYFVGKIVFDVVGRRAAEGRSERMASSISSLQARYFSELKSLDLAQAESIGLHEASHALYAVRAGAEHTALLIGKRP